VYRLRGEIQFRMSFDFSSPAFAVVTRVRLQPVTQREVFFRWQMLKSVLVKCDQKYRRSCFPCEKNVTLEKHNYVTKTDFHWNKFYHTAKSLVSRTLLRDFILIRRQYKRNWAVCLLHNIHNAHRAGTSSTLTSSVYKKIKVLPATKWRPRKQ